MDSVAFGSPEYKACWICGQDVVLGVYGFGTLVYYSGSGGLVNVVNIT